jgi:hypothetical protein
LIGFSCGGAALAFISAALRAPASLLVQPAAITAITLASHMIGQLSRFSILVILMGYSLDPTVLAFLKTAPEIAR